MKIHRRGARSAPHLCSGYERYIGALASVVWRVSPAPPALGPHPAERRSRCRTSPSGSRGAAARLPLLPPLRAGQAGAFLRHHRVAVPFQSRRLVTSESALRRSCVAASERPLIGRRGCCRSFKASVSSVTIGTLTSPAIAVSPLLSASGNSSDVARGPHSNASRRAGDRSGGKSPIRATQCSPPGVA
jgi:hypothetical protein